MTDRTARVYITVLAAIAVAALIAATVMGVHKNDVDIAPVATIGGAAVGALASLASQRPPHAEGESAPEVKPDDV